MNIIKKHWLYRDCKFNVDVKEESNCGECIHCKVCKIEKETFCENYCFGTSQYDGCGGCLHRFTRPSYTDDNSFPCFKCKFFESPMIVPLGEKHE